MLSLTGPFFLFGAMSGPITHMKIPSLDELYEGVVYVPGELTPAALSSPFITNTKSFVWLKVWPVRALNVVLSNTTTIPSPAFTTFDNTHALSDEPDLDLT